MKLKIIDYVRLLFRGRAAVEELMAQGKLVNEARKAGIKTVGFWATVVTGIGAVAAQAAGIVPAPAGAIVLSASTLFYAISRGLVKRGDALGGVKPALTTSEVWANILAAVGQVAMAASSVSSPEVAVGLAALNAAAISAADNLAKSGAQPPVQ